MTLEGLPSNRWTLTLVQDDSLSQLDHRSKSWKMFMEVGHLSTAYSLFIQRLSSRLGHHHIFPSFRYSRDRARLNGWQFLAQSLQLILLWRKQARRSLLEHQLHNVRLKAFIHSIYDCDFSGFGTCRHVRNYGVLILFSARCKRHLSA